MWSGPAALLVRLGRAAGGGVRGQEVAEDVEGDGEHDGRVVLRGDAAEGLQVAQLQHKPGSVPRPRPAPPSPAAPRGCP